MKRVYNIFLCCIMLFFDFLSVIHAVGLSQYGKLPTYLALPFLLTLPFVLEKLFKVHFHQNLKVIYFTFIFLADFLGCVVGLYNYTSWFDLFAHFLSGVLTALLGILLMKIFRYKETKLTTVIYVLGFVSLVAVLWEFFEYSMDLFIGMNLQHSIESGVGDTMEDILSAFLGSIVFLIFYLNTKKTSLFHRFITNIKIQ